MLICFCAANFIYCRKALKLSAELSVGVSLAGIVILLYKEVRFEPEIHVDLLDLVFVVAISAVVTVYFALRRKKKK